MQKEILLDPKKLVPLLNRKLYEKGDCYSPGTGFCIKKDYKVYLAPAESNPDLLDEDDIFTFNEMLDENGNPSVDVAPTDSSLEPSKYSKLYLHLLEEFSCNCVLLVESQCAKLAGDLYSDSLVFSNVECLTNIISTVTKEKLRTCDSLNIPIITDKQPQEELISDLINALYSNTSTCCCIIKGFGMIFLGDCWKSVRSMLETVKQLLQYELNILQYRIRSDLSQQISGINRQINEIRQQISSDNYNKPSMTITNNTQQFKDDKSAKPLDKISKDDLANVETELETHAAKESTPKDDGLMSFLNNVDEENINDDLLLDDNEQGEADFIEDTANNELNVSEGTNGKLNNSEMKSTKTDATQDTEKIQQPKPVAKTATRRQTRKSTNKKETSDSSPNKNAPETEEKSTNNDSDKNVAEDDKTSAKKPAETIVSKRPTRASARVTTAKSPKPAQTKATEKKSSTSKTLEDKATPNKVSESVASENQSTSNTATEGKALEENSQANKETPKKVAGSTSTAKATPKANSKTANANKTPEKVKDSSSKTLTTEKSPNNALAKESVHDKNKPKSNIEKKKDNSPAKEDQSELDLEIDLNPFEQDELFEGIDRSEFEEKEDPAKDDDKPVEDDSCIILDDDDEVEATSSSQNKRSRTSKSPEKGEYKRSRFSYSPEAEKQKKRTVDELAKLVIPRATPSTAATAARVAQYTKKVAANNSQNSSSQAATQRATENSQSQWTKKILGTSASTTSNKSFEQKKLEAQAKAAQAYAVEMARRANASKPSLPVPANASRFAGNSNPGSGIQTQGHINPWSTRSSLSPGRQLPAPAAARQSLPTPVASRQLPAPVPGGSSNAGQRYGAGQLQLPMPVQSQQSSRYDKHAGCYTSAYTNTTYSNFHGSNNMPNMMAYSGHNMPTNSYSQQNDAMRNMSTDEIEETELIRRRREEIAREKMQLMMEMGISEEELRILHPDMRM